MSLSRQYVGMASAAFVLHVVYVTSSARLVSDHRVNTATHREATTYLPFTIERSVGYQLQ